MFLCHIVEGTIKGRRGDIKEYVIGVAFYRKRQDFDPRLDSTVRVEASRMRGRLAKFYAEEGKHDTIVISVPKGGYVPAVEVHAPAEQPAAPAAPTLTGNSTTVQLHAPSAQP